MKVHKMSYLECMNMDIVDYIDYLEFDIVRNPIEHDTTGDIQMQEGDRWQGQILRLELQVVSFKSK